MEIREADSVVFFWEAPQWDPDSVQYYQIFYQSVNGTSWSLLKDSVAPMANPEIAIYRTEIPSSDSLFVFSVRYVTASGALSPLHFSADSTAIPAGGWFMFWKAK